MTETLNEPTADQLLVNLYNTRMKKRSEVDLIPGKKYGICRVRLAASVNQPADYPVLKASLEALAGIQQVVLLIDGQCPVNVAAGRQLDLICEVVWMDDFFNTAKHQIGREVLNTEQQYVIPVIRFTDAVERSDYAAMESAMEGVTGIQACDFFADHDFADASVCRVVANVHLRMDDIP